jgi:hypothetical protein
MACQKEAAAKKFGAGRRRVCGRTERSIVLEPPDSRVGGNIENIWEVETLREVEKGADVGSASRPFCLGYGCFYLTSKRCHRFNTFDQSISR